MGSRLGPALALAALLGAGVPASGDPAGPGLERVPREKILAAAREIDRLLEADLAANNLKPNAPLDDASFVRRAYVDLVGRIPTEREASAFLADGSSERREALIDRLLVSPGASSHLFNWLADLLRVKTRLTNNVSGEPYIHFIKESLAANKPWDAFVRELLTASGPAHARGHGATGYYLRDTGMPEDNMSNTITVFLGTRLECAQCHNHPFDKWTQIEYHRMVAFTGGMRFRDESFNKTDDGKRLQAIQDALRGPKGAPKEKKENLELQAMQRVLQPLGYGISGSGNGLYRLPKDYQYPDAKPNEVVKAKAMFGTDVALAAEPAAADRRPVDPKKKAPAVKAVDVNSREIYAKWLTAPENPRFTTVIANRMWKRLFGLGLIEPLENMRDATKAVNPELMKHLETTMVGLGYDLRQFIRVLANSRAWQREACHKAPGEDETFRFPGPLLRRMSAEQLWDSMVTLVVPDVDAALETPGEMAEPVYTTYERLIKIPEEELKGLAEMEALRRKDPAAFKDAQKKKAEAAKADPEHQKKLAELQDKLKTARKAGDEAAEAKLREELRAMEKGAAQPYAMMMDKAPEKKRNVPGGLERASDLPQPANPGHFLREFGQSDREQIGASHTESTIPQALSLLNGFVDKSILPNAKSAVRQAAAEAKSAPDKVKAIFRAVLSRDPSEKERGAWVSDVDKRGDAAVRDLIWALVNTHEFMFIR